MRGGFGVAQDPFAKAIENLGKARYESKGGGLDEVSVAPDATFMESAWVFTNPYAGGEYVKRFIDCNQEELMDVVTVFFHKLKQMGEREVELKKKIKELEEDLALYNSSGPTPLQLLG